MLKYPIVKYFPPVEVVDLPGHDCRDIVKSSSTRDLIDRCTDAIFATIPTGWTPSGKIGTGRPNPHHKDRTEIARMFNRNDAIIKKGGKLNIIA